jgi:hypothetical protein
VHLAHYLALLHRSQTQLGDAFRTVARSHADEHDVHAICEKLAAQCDRHAEQLKPFAERYGEDADGGPERLHGEIFGGPREGPLGGTGSSRPGAAGRGPRMRRRDGDADHVGTQPHEASRPASARRCVVNAVPDAGSALARLPARGLLAADFGFAGFDFLGVLVYLPCRHLRGPASFTAGAAEPARRPRGSAA